MRRSSQLVALFFSIASSACGGSSATDSAPGSAQKGGTAAATRATRVETATLQTSLPVVELVLPGEVEGSRDAQLASSLGGYVERVLKRVGDNVKAGDSIAWINRSVLDAQVEQAAAQLDLAQADLAVAEKAGRSMPKSRRDAAFFGAKAAEATHRLATIQAGRGRIRAPFDGVLAKVYVEDGEVLPPGGRVARLVKLDPVTVSVTVSDRDVVNLTPGMPAKITTGAAPAPKDAVVSRVSPAADLNTRAFEVELDVNNAERDLLPGMITTVRLSLELSEAALAIPQHVLVTRRDGNGAFVVQEGVARWRPVSLGRVIAGQVIVKEGLALGDEVVVTGHRELVDGDPLIVVRSGVCCQNGAVHFPEL